MDNFSVSLACYARRWKKIVWAAVLILMGLSVYLVAHRGFNSNLLDLIPERAKKTRLYLDLARDFGIMDEVYVIFSGDIRRSIKAVDAFADAVAKGGLVEKVKYQLDPGMKTFFSSMFRNNALLYLSEEDLETALDRLEPDVMKQQLSKVRDRLLLPSSGLSIADPLSFSELLFPSIPPFDMPVDTTSGYYLSEDGQRLYMMLHPASKASDVSYDRRLMTFLNETYRQTFGGNPSLEMGITGSHAITFHEQNMMRRDMQVNIISSFIVVGGLFLIFLGTMRGMLYAFVPVISAVAITLGIGTALMGAMSEVSGAFGAMLVGLGVDLTIVLYIRFLLDRNMETSIKDRSGAIWAGAFTTAATFYPMMLSEFRGLREFGFLTATGILLCGFFVFSLSAPLMKGKGGIASTRHTGLESLPAFALRHRVLLLVIVSIFAALSLYGFTNIGFSADLAGLGSEKNPARQLFISLGIEREKTFVTGTVKTPEEAVTVTSRISDTLASHGVSRPASLSAFIPERERQMKNIEKIRRVNREEISVRFKTVAGDLGFSPYTIQTMTRNLLGFLSVREPVILQDALRVGAGEFLNRFYRQEGNRFRFLVITDGKNDVAGMLPEENVTGTTYVRQELSSILKYDAVLITIVGLFLVNIILLLRFRNILFVLYSQVPVVLAILVVGGVMAELGMKIHIMNAIVGVMLFGIGTDYSIHLIHAITRGEDINTIMRSTGRAIAVAAFTTIGGFGSLYFSSYKGLSEMGLVVGLGCLLTLIFNLLLIPIFMKKHLRSGNNVSSAYSA